MPESNDCLVVGQAGEELSIVAGFVEELEQILELSRALALEKSLGVTCCPGVPLEQGLLCAWEMIVEAGMELLPGMVYGRLVEETVYYVGMAPVRLVAAVLVVAGDVVEVAVSAGEESSTEPAGPRSFPLRVLDDALGVRAGGTAVGVLVVLIEGVGAPEDAVAVGAWIPLVPFVELVLVSLPVELALESHVAKGAPESPWSFGRSSVAGLGCWCSRRRCGRGQLYPWWLWLCLHLWYYQAQVLGPL